MASPGDGNRKRKKNGESSHGGAGPSTSQRASATSPEPKELPGFVYDPVTRRYFRVSDRGPNNNFNVATDHLLSRHREITRRKEVWIEQAVKKASSMALSSLLHSVYLPPSLSAPRLQTRKIAAFQHSYLSHLDPSSAKHSSRKADCGDSNEYGTSFGIADVSHGEEPSVYMSMGSPYEHCPLRRSFFMVRYGLKWEKKKKNGRGYQLVSRTWLKALLDDDRLPVPAITGIKVETMKALPGSIDNEVVLLCEVETRPGSQINTFPGCLLLTSGDDLEVKLGGSFPHVQRICAFSTDRQNRIVGTATADSGEVHLMRFEDSAMKIVTFPGIVSSLEFFASNNNNLFLVGNRTSQVFLSDVRQPAQSKELLGAKKWKALDVSGHCVITGIKSLTNNRFITTVAALPEQVPKMLMWDLRNACKTPVAVYEDTSFLFNRKPPTLSLSLDETLVAASDSEGVTRFWDVDSGSILARLPPHTSLSLEEVQKCPPVSVICGNKYGGRAVIEILLGKRPSVHVLNL